MKTLVKHSLYNKVLLSLSLLFCTTVFADDINLAYEFSEEMDWTESSSLNSDILEPINRPVHHFNDFVYQHVLDPVTKFYVDRTPNLVRISFKNFFSNLKYPIRFVSNVLQFKIKEAYYESLKFGINSTIGIFGINTPSEKYSVLNEIPDEDLGQVLAVWGIPEGPYIMVPILGPSTLRDLPARFVGRKINNIDINSDNWDTVDSKWIALLNTAEILSINEEMLPRYESVKKTSIDFYTSLRSAYLQQRDQAISE